MRKFIPIFILLIFCFTTAAQEGVYVEIGNKKGNVSFGQGILKSRGGECFVISPAHLFSDATDNFRIIGSNNRLSQANNLESFEYCDLAISRVISGGEQECTAWAVPLDYKNILKKASQGILETKLENGETEIIYIQFDSKQTGNIDISPLRSDQRLKQGYSGSPVFVSESGRKILIGILQVVEDGGRQASLLPANDMERILGGFFDEKSTTILDKSSFKKKKSSTKAAILRPFEDIGVKFELIDYSKLESKMIFQYMVTATEKDETLVMYNSQQVIYDERGYEIKGSKLKIGPINSTQFSYDLVQGISVPLTITFENVPNNMTGMSLLKAMYKGSRGSAEFEIRNLAVEKNNDFIKPQYETSWSYEDGGIRFNLLDYRKSGSKLVFDYVVTATEKDETLVMYNSQQIIYDEKGYEVKGSKLKIGPINSTQFSYDLVQGISVPLTITFENVPNNMTGMSLLKAMYKGSRGSAEFEIRNLAAEKNKDFIKPQYESSWSYEDGGIRFNLLDYRKSGSKLVFDYVVTATEKDETLVMYNSQQIIYDANGYEIKGSKLKIGPINSTQFSYNLVQGISVPLTIAFENVPNNMIGISLLKAMYKGSRGNAVFEIRNLAAEKNNDFIKPQYESSWSYEDGGIRFNLLDYRKSGSKLVFDYVVTATEKDETLVMYNSQQIIYDANGYEIKGSKLKIGPINSTQFSYNLVQGISVPLTIAFENVPNNMTGISLLKAMYKGSRGNAVFEIRNLNFK